MRGFLAFLGCGLSSIAVIVFFLFIIFFVWPLSALLKTFAFIGLSKEKAEALKRFIEAEMNCGDLAEVGSETEMRLGQALNEARSNLEKAAVGDWRLPLTRIF